MIEVPADQTRDGIARRFVCDKPAGHEVDPDDDGKHRQVTDNDEGRAIEWPSSHPRSLTRGQG